MPILREIIDPREVYTEDNVVVRQLNNDRYTPPGFTGDTTSNEYMPYLCAFRGASELVVHGDSRALIYKMHFYEYNAMYSRRSRGFNRDFNEILSAFSRGGKTYLINGDVGCEIYAGLILQRVVFTEHSNRTDSHTPLIMLGVKPEYVFSGNMTETNLDPSQFVLYVNSILADNPIYSKMYKKFHELIILPLIQHGVRVTYTPGILPEMFRVRRYDQKFSSAGALVDYKRSFNNAIDLGDTVNVDYRYPGAIHHEVMTEEIFDLPVPEIHTDQIVNYPGADGNPFTVTMDTEAIPQATIDETLRMLRTTGIAFMDPEVEETFEIID